MKKRMIALGMAVLMTAMSAIPAYAKAGWIMGNNQKWCYLDEQGNRVRNTVKKSGDFYWWLGPSGWLWENHEGQEVVVGNGITFTLRKDGSLSRKGYDAEGKEYDIFDVMGDGSFSGKYNAWGFNRIEGQRAWIYYGEDGEPVTGLQEIDGYTYLFDEKGESRWETDTRYQIVNGYYQMDDYTVAVNRWIGKLVKDENGRRDRKWFYFGEDGKQVFGEQEIDGITYDFGTKGYLENSQLEFPEIASIELDTSVKEAEVGDVVELPFKIYVYGDEIGTATPDSASPSNARRKTARERVELEDYSIFESMCDVSHSYRVNEGVRVPYYEEGKSHLRYEVETKYEIDWDEQVIRIPIDYMGAVFGNMRIGDGRHNYISENFEIICNYFGDQDTGEKVQNLLTAKAPNANAVVVNGLRTLAEDDVDSMKDDFISSGELRDTLQAFEWSYNGVNQIDTYLSVDRAAGEQISDEEANVIGLGFSMDNQGSIGMKIGMSDETLPADLTEDGNTVALDLSVYKKGVKTDKLDVPAIISLPKPEGIDQDEFRLYHIHDGETEEVDYVYEDGQVVFAAEEYSTFVFVEDEKPQKPSHSGSSGGGSGTASSETVAWDAKKGMVSSAKGILTGQGASYSKWISEQQDQAVGTVLWKLQYADGTFAAGSYRTDDQGKQVIGADGKPVEQIHWEKVNGAWYAFGVDGYAKSGLVYDALLNGWFYIDINTGMQIDWQQIGGTWYYFNPISNEKKGMMYVNCQTPDGYRVDETGAWIDTAEN